MISLQMIAIQMETLGSSLEYIMKDYPDTHIYTL